MSEKIKVLIIWGGALNNSGVPGVLETIIRSLSDKVDFTLVASEGKNSKLENFLALGTKVEFIRDTLPKNRLYRKIYYYLFRNTFLKIQIKKIIKNQDFKVVHCVSGLLSGNYLKCAQNLKIPIRIAHCHGKISKNVNIIRRLQIKHLQNNINKFATVKLTCSYEAGKTFFANSSNMITLVNPIDTNKFSESIPKSESKTLRLLQIGVYNDNKNQLFSLEVVKELKRCGIDIEFRVIGFPNSGLYFDKIQSFIYENDLNDCVSILHSDEDKTEIFKMTDVLLLPSKSEACPLVALEAQATYTPVCCSNFVPKDIDFGMCEFIELDCKKWTAKIVDMKNHNYIRKDSFDKNDVKSYTNAIYDMYCKKEK